MSIEQINVTSIMITCVQEEELEAGLDVAKVTAAGCGRHCSLIHHDASMRRKWQPSHVSKFIYQKYGAYSVSL